MTLDLTKRGEKGSALTIAEHDENFDSIETEVNAKLGPGDQITQLDGTAWRILYVDGSGDVVELGLGTSGQVLKSNGGSSAPSWVSAAGGAVSVDGLTDASITTPLDDDILAFDGGSAEWVNQTLTSLLSLVDGYVNVPSDINATAGTADNTTFLRGDGQWAVPSGTGGEARDYDVVAHDTDNDGTTLSAAQGKWYQVTGSANLTVTWDGANIDDEKSSVVEKLSGHSGTLSHEAAATYTLNGAASPGTDTQNNSLVFMLRVGSDFQSPDLEASEEREAISFFNTVTLDTGASLACADKEVSRPELKDYAETSTTPSSSSGTLTLDLENGNVFEVTLTENVTTVNLNNPPASGGAGSVLLILDQGTGGFTVSWPGSVVWPGGTAPTLSSGANDVDVISLVTRDGGTTWYGFEGGLDFS